MNTRLPRFAFVAALALTACSSATDQEPPQGQGGSACDDCAGGGGAGAGPQQPLAVTEVAIAPSDGQGRDRFGAAVALSGERLLVGAAGVDDVAIDAGAAYVFERDPNGAWLERAKLLPSGAFAYDAIGSAVDVDGDVAIIGGAGTNAPPDSNAHEGAYVFERTPDGAWVQTADLAAVAGGVFDDQFGMAVGVSGNVVVVGAPFDETANGFIPGKAYVFERTNGWQLTQEILHDGAGRLGNAVAIDGDVMALGAPSGLAVVFVYERMGGAWVLTATLGSPEPMGETSFGDAVAVAGHRIVVGDPVRELDGKSRVGASYVFERDDLGAWAFTAKLEVPTLSTEARFGAAVAATPMHAFVGTGNRNRFYLYDQDPAGNLVEDGYFFGNATSAFGTALAASGPYAAAGGPVPEFHDTSGVSEVGSVVVYEGLRVAE